MPIPLHAEHVDSLQSENGNYFQAVFHVVSIGKWFPNSEFKTVNLFTTSVDTLWSMKELLAAKSAVLVPQWQ